MTTDEKAVQKYSAEWVRQQAIANGATWLPNHDCACCGVYVGYVISGEQVFYRSACGCGWSPQQPSSFREIAEWLAMQSADEIRDRIMERLR